MAAQRHTAVKAMGQAYVTKCHHHEGRRYSVAEMLWLSRLQLSAVKALLALLVIVREEYGDDLAGEMVRTTTPSATYFDVIG